MSYNIHKGFAPLGSRAVLTQIKAAIKKTGAQVVFLQEVLGHHTKHAPKESQFEYLADQIWTHFAYGKNAVYTEGNHGNAILSEHPITQQDWINLSTNRFEQRGLLHAVIEYPPGKPLHLLNVHLDLLERGRKKQLEQICERIQSAIPKNQALILAGDFNDWGKRAGQILSQKLGLEEAHETLHGAPAKTFPSIYPILSLDRIYTRGFAIQSVKVLTGEPYSSLSDHLPLLAKVKLT